MHYALYRYDILGPPLKGLCLWQGSFVRLHFEIEIFRYFEVIFYVRRCLGGAG